MMFNYIRPNFHHETKQTNKNSPIVHQSINYIGTYNNIQNVQTIILFDHLTIDVYLSVSLRTLITSI